VGSSTADLCAQERQMETNILAHRFLPSPSISSITNFRIFFSCTRPSGLVWLESIHGLRIFRIACCTHIRSRQGHPRNTSSRPPSSFPTLQHQIIMQELLKSWKAAGLEQVWESAVFLPKWCKTVLEWSMACSPHPHLTFFTQPDIMTYVLISMP